MDGSADDDGALIVNVTATTARRSWQATDEAGWFCPQSPTS